MIQNQFFQILKKMQLKTIYRLFQHIFPKKKKTIRLNFVKKLQIFTIKNICKLLKL